MSQTNTRKSILVERTMPWTPEKIWLALITADVLGRWLMRSDFQPVIGHHFQFHAQPVPGWSGFTNCEVVEVDRPRRLVYRWGDSTKSDSGLRTVVKWTLTATGNGAVVRMEQSGFRPQEERGYKGMGGVAVGRGSCIAWSA